MSNKLIELPIVSIGPVQNTINKFIEGYITNKQTNLGSYCIAQEVKHIACALENEKQIHIRNNESLDKISEILLEELRKEDLSREERKDIYSIFAQISNIHKESEMQNTRHITTRVITAMGIMGSVAISLGSILIHEKYKTKRNR